MRSPPNPQRLLYQAVGAASHAQKPESAHEDALAIITTRTYLFARYKR
jgi:hypothetical protein